MNAAYLKRQGAIWDARHRMQQERVSKSRVRQSMLLKGYYGRAKGVPLAPVEDEGSQFAAVTHVVTPPHPSLLRAAAARGGGVIITGGGVGSKDRGEAEQTAAYIRNAAMQAAIRREGTAAPSDDTNFAQQAMAASTFGATADSADNSVKQAQTDLDGAASRAAATPSPQSAADLQTASQAFMTTLQNAIQSNNLSYEYAQLLLSKYQSRFLEQQRTATNAFMLEVYRQVVNALRTYLANKNVSKGVFMNTTADANAPEARPVSTLDEAGQTTEDDFASPPPAPYAMPSAGPSAGPTPSLPGMSMASQGVAMVPPAAPPTANQPNPTAASNVPAATQGSAGLASVFSRLFGGRDAAGQPTMPGRVAQSGRPEDTVFVDRHGHLPGNQINPGTDLLGKSAVAMPMPTGNAVHMVPTHQVQGPAHAAVTGRSLQGSDDVATHRLGRILSHAGANNIGASGTSTSLAILSLGLAADGGLAPTAGVRGFDALAPGRPSLGRVRRPAPSAPPPDDSAFQGNAPPPWMRALPNRPGDRAQRPHAAIAAGPGDEPENQDMMDEGDRGPRTRADRQVQDNIDGDVKSGTANGIPVNTNVLSHSAVATTAQGRKAANYNYEHDPSVLTSREAFDAHTGGQYAGRRVPDHVIRAWVQRVDPHGLRHRQGRLKASLHKTFQGYGKVDKVGPKAGAVPKSAKLAVLSRL